MLNKKILNFLYYFIFVSIGFFFSPYLIQKGMEPVIIGYLTTIGLILMIVLYFVLGRVSDKKLSNKAVLIVNFIIAIVIFWVLILSNNFFALGISYILSYGCFMVLAPILDGLILQDLDGSQYGGLRSYGSLGAAISYFFNTFFLNNKYGYNTIIFIDIIFLIIMILSLIKIKEKQTKKEKNKIKEGLTYIITNKELIFVVFLAFLTYGTLKADDPYSYIYNSEFVKQNTITIGIVGSLAIFFESFIMKVTEHVKEIIRINNYLIGSLVLLVIYFTRFMFYDYQIIIIIGNILIGLFIGIFVPSAIKTINIQTPTHLRNTMLGIYQMAISLGGVVIGFITNLYLTFNHFLPNIYLVHTIVISLSLILIALSTGLFKNKYSSN